MTTTSLFLKRSIKSAASAAGTRMGFPQPQAGCVHIVAYHRVVKDIRKAERDAIYGIVISTETFRRHCEMLARAFDVVSLETASHFLHDRRKVARPMAVITFDDGYADFYDQALPVLNDLALPATVFIPSASIGSSQPLAHDRIYWLLKLYLETSTSIRQPLLRVGLNNAADRDLSARSLLTLTEALVYLPSDIRERAITELERELGDNFEPYPSEYTLLDWDQVREASRKGINFGSHTRTHAVLTLENDDVTSSEVRLSKTEIEDELGKRISTFAYPNGEYSQEVADVIRQAGFVSAVTTEGRINVPGDDLLTLGRISLCEESTRGIAGVYSEKVAAMRLGV
jgi:peptidoglycan/xylan/chitin deacetylase (PgdA/CDA1 family)